MKSANILLVEDDPNLSMVLKDFLEMLNYAVMLARNGKEGLKAFRENSFDLCILDVMMPEKDGFTLAEDIRKISDSIPIIFLTAKSLKEDRIRGFQAGCDDYISKPFNTDELSLRIQAIMRRCENRMPKHDDDINKIYTLGSYSFKPANMDLKRAQKSRSLTRKETALLKFFCEHKNQLVAREQILNEVWGDDDYFLGRSMDVFIAKLRKYLREDPSLSITNVHGAGFKLETDLSS
ncbi:MAG: response regulator transcription factor [Bacteroidota bacterium]